MKSTASQRAAGIIRLAFLFVLVFSIVDGCSKDSSSTGPYDSPAIPSVNGHWVGTGTHQALNTTLNFTMVADFVQGFVTQWDSKFVGTMSTTWTDPGFWVTGQTNQMYCKGTVSTFRKVTLDDTGGVAMFGTPVKTVPVETALYSHRTSVVLSANGDTLSYSGSSGIGPEVFVLVKQK